MRHFLFTLLAVLCFPVFSFAQGVLIIVGEPVPLPRPIPRPISPSPPRATYTVDQIDIQANIKDQLADVQVSQTFSNPGPGTIEAQFVFPLPYDAAINEMTLLVNGKELPARLLNAEEARKRYAEIVRKSKDPALLEWMGAGLFQTSVFPIPAGENRTVSIHYNQLLRKTGTLVDFLFPLSTAQYTSKPVNKLSIRIDISSAEELKNVFSPTHEVAIKRADPRQASVTYSAQNSIPRSDFRLLFDSSAGTVGATLLSYRPDAEEDGYFLLLATPEFNSNPQKHFQKTISFVVDTSGSMSGKKMEQAQDAARFVLQNLDENDLFNVINYSSNVASFQPELEKLSPQSRQAAIEYVNNLHAGGGTNIQDALLRSLKDLNDPNRPAYLLFLTDGLPTSGETNESRIGKAVREANLHHARLLCFGVGYDVNSRLLDRLARDNHGMSDYVRPDENIESAIARVYQRISSPVMTDIRVAINSGNLGSSSVNRLYPAGTLDLFQDQQLVLAGRYRKSGEAQIKLTGKAGESEKSFEFAGTLTDKSPDQTNAFIARLWATRRIGEIIDELDLNGSNQELVDELTKLSTRYGILTPYTAFLADDTVRPELASAANQKRTLDNLQRLNESGGKLGFEQRAAKQRFKNAGPSSSIAEPMQAAGSLNVELDVVPSMKPDAASSPTLIQKSGNTLYRRGKLIVTPETAGLDLKRDEGKITRIPRYSQEYFDIVALNTQAENQLFSEQGDDEELLVELRGMIYLIQ